MRRFIPIVMAAGLVIGMTPAMAHERDLITPGGRVGPIRTNRTTTAEMKQIFGEPSSRKVIRVGCSRVIRLRWRDQIQTLTYSGDEQRRIVDVKVLARDVQTSQAGRTYSFHTRRGLRVGDSEARLRELYPGRRDGHSHRGHTHYLLGESDSGTRLIAKVVGRKVVELEAAPYEFC